MAMAMMDAARGTGGKGGIGGKNAVPLKISTTSEIDDPPAAQTRQIFKSAHESTHNRSSKPITTFNTFTSSTTHLDHPQTVPVPEMAATLRQDQCVRRSALRCSMRQLCRRKYQQRQNLMHLQRKRVRSSNQRTSRRTTAPQNP